MKRPNPEEYGTSDHGLIYYNNKLEKYCDYLEGKANKNDDLNSVVRSVDVSIVDSDIATLKKASGRCCAVCSFFVKPL